MNRHTKPYFCAECGTTLTKWVGKCPDCQAWNSIQETATPQSTAAWQASSGTQHVPATVLPLSEIDTPRSARASLGMAELDRVLGGGLVQGSVVLIGGAPGAGKSTLLMQALSRFQAPEGQPGLYITAEESAEQVALRARHLQLPLDTVHLLSESRLEGILSASGREKPPVMVVDSIQTVHAEHIRSAPGSVAQVRECAACLTRFAKQSGTSLFLVGHVTKEGMLAGPRVLEHMVDTVLYFEGENEQRLRMIRTVKNRFGAINELGVFAMTDRGLREVKNPSAIFLSRQDRDVPGSVVMVAREGTRLFLVEVQALVDTCQYGTPRRTVLGGDPNRLAMLLAVLHRHTGIASSDQEVYINVVGGVRITETALDLAMLFAVLSSLRGVALPRTLALFGELGLAGEIRPVQNGVARVNEAARHGFTQLVLPKANCPDTSPKGIALHTPDTLQEALTLFDSLLL